jgi:hypothetical protein
LSLRCSIIIEPKETEENCRKLKRLRRRKTLKKFFEFFFFFKKKEEEEELTLEEVLNLMFPNRPESEPDYEGFDSDDISDCQSSE